MDPREKNWPGSGESCAGQGPIPASRSRPLDATPATRHGADGARESGRLVFAFYLNLGFTILEIAGGFFTNSVAILANAVHDVGDCFALGSAWYLERLSVRVGDGRYSYGYRRFSLLGALISTAILLVGSILILSEAVPRLVRPEPSNARGMVLVAMVGVLVNGAAVWRLRGGRSLNGKIVAWHLIEDVLDWLAILIVSVVLTFKDVRVLDPALSLVIMMYVLYNVLRAVRRTMGIFLQGAPEGIDLEAIERAVETVGGVRTTHHTHLWSLDGIQHVFSSHIAVDPGVTPQGATEIKRAIRALLATHGIEHTTLEIEFPEESCPVADAACRRRDS
jgi:cobalt-zinc-cadmium efflux system protein